MHVSKCVGRASVNTVIAIVSIVAAQTVAMAILIASANAAQSYSFSKIAETGTPFDGPIGATQGFTSFGIPAFDGSHIAFTATSYHSHPGFVNFDGVYVAPLSDGGLQLVAENFPDGQSRFTSFGHVSIDEGKVAFSGSYAAINGSQAVHTKGVYTNAGGTLHVVADTTTTIPGTLAPPSPASARRFDEFAFSFPSLGGESVAFRGEGPAYPGFTGKQAGIYTDLNGSLARVVDRSTPLFNSVHMPVLDDNKIAFIAQSGASNGVYVFNGTNVQPLVSTNTQVPASTDYFEVFVNGTLSFDDGEAAFAAQSDSERGIYVSNGTSTRTIINNHSAMPGRSGELFLGGHATSIDGDTVVFAGADTSHRGGLYSYLDGGLAKVLEDGDSLFGKTVMFLEIGNEALAQGRIAFRATFDDSTSGIFLATYVPSESTSIGGPSGVTQASLLGGTQADQAGGLNADFTSSVASEGTFQASYLTPNESTFAGTYSGSTTGFDLGNFLTSGPAGSYQVWDLEFTGTLIEGAAVTLQFKYDDAGLTPLQEDLLGIWHFGEYGPNGAREWKWLRDSIDTSANVITITTDNFSPFAAGFQAVPEPGTIWLFGGLFAVVVQSRRRR